MASGKCGKNLTWTLDDDGTLTISGRGDMKNYFLDNSTPWYHCRASITKVAIKNGVTTIGISAFKGCTGLTSVIIPDSVITIGISAFKGCIGLTSVIIPDSVITIGARAFSDCKSLTIVINSNSVTTIGDWAFYACTSLANVIIPSSVTMIGHWAFSGCTSLANVIIPSSVTMIGAHAFSWCKSLMSVIIPDSVTTIGGWFFYHCTSLKKVYYKRNTKINLESLTVGNNAKLIPYDDLPLAQVEPPAQTETPAQAKPPAQVKPPAQAKPPVQVKPPAQVEPPAAKKNSGWQRDANGTFIYYPSNYTPVQKPAPLVKETTPAQAEPPVQAEPPAQVKPPAQAEPPAQTEPPAETNCTVYKNTKTDRAENIAPPNAKKLKLVDENIAEIRRAAELAAMNIVMTIERDLGFSPEDVSSQNLGYDIKSTSRDGKTLRLIEVKGRHIDAETVTVSRNEIDAALNNPDNFILAIVRLDGDNNETTYIRQPFELPPDRAALSVNFSIQKLVEVSG